jgi:hypothetical protein
MQKIQAIETRYKGYRFRSRLEARWAVFFDMLGIRWEYEKEGYDLGRDGRYLPDFWLPDMERWIEIKGQEPTASEILKLESLARVTKCDAFLVVGVPDISMPIYMRCVWLDDGLSTIFAHEELSELSDILSDISVLAGGCDVVNCKCDQECLMCLVAISAARAARFELEG